MMQVNALARHWGARQPSAKPFCQAARHPWTEHKRQYLCRASGNPDSADAPTRTSGGASSSGRSSGIQWKYKSDDGHYKATIEEAFGTLSPSELKGGTAPWKMGWQVNEKNVKWSEDLNVRMVKAYAAQEAGLSEEEMEDRITSLVALLPDIVPRLASMKAALLARLAGDVDFVAARLLDLKRIFPRANCGRMLAKELGLLAQPLEAIEASAAALRELLPGLDIDALVQENPSVLSVKSFSAAINDARRLMPNVDINRILMTDPEFVLSLQKGNDMIPYDAIPQNPWGHK